MVNIGEMKVSKDPMELIVEIKNVYGNETIYPLCQKGILLANFKNQKTFTPKDIQILMQLDYTFVVCPSKL